MNQVVEERGATGAGVCISREGRFVHASPALVISKRGGGGVRVEVPASPVADDAGGAAGKANPWRGQILLPAWRLIAPRADELLALRAIRARAGRAAACTSVAQLAVDLQTTRTRAAHLMGRLHAKGWIVTDCRRTQYLPTSMASLCYRMLDVEHLVRALVQLDGRRIPEGMRGLVALARDLWSDAGPDSGCVGHPAAAPRRTHLGAVYFGAGGGRRSRARLAAALRGRGVIRGRWTARRARS